MAPLKNIFISLILAVPAFAACGAALPSTLTLRVNSRLPDPFTFYDGTKVTSHRWRPTNAEAGHKLVGHWQSVASIRYEGQERERGNAASAHETDGSRRNFQSDFPAEWPGPYALVDARSIQAGDPQRRHQIAEEFRCWHRDVY